MFKPTVKITAISKNALSLTLLDTTPAASGTYPDGYGSAGAPASFADIARVEVAIQYLNETYVAATEITGTLDTGLVVNFQLRDGVHTVKVTYFLANDTPFDATVMALVLNTGSAGLVKDIANMAVANCGCDYNESKKLIERLLLKLAAQTSFGNGDFVKAHTAAQLLNNSIITNIIPCTTCG